MGMPLMHTHVGQFHGHVLASVEYRVFASRIVGSAVLRTLMGKFSYAVAVSPNIHTTAHARGTKVLKECSGLTPHNSQRMH